MDKKDIIKEYLRIKLLVGHQPSLKEFYEYSSISKRRLSTIYPKNGWSSLVIDSGDKPKEFSHPKSEFNLILKQYGELARKLGYLPVYGEWDNAGLRPTVSGIESSHKVRWGKLKFHFKKFAEGKEEWRDVIGWIPTEDKLPETTGEDCYVYLMKDKFWYKIGISKNVEFREKTLQSEKPTITLIAFKKFVNRRIAAAFEKALHESYSHKRKRGEWFSFDDDEIRELKLTLED